MKKLQVQIEDELMKQLKQFALDKETTLKEAVSYSIQLTLKIYSKDAKTRVDIFKHLVDSTELPKLGEE